MAAVAESRNGLTSGWANGDDAWGSAVNANFLKIGLFGMHLSVKSRQNDAAPPGAPTNGDCYMITGTPTGAWAGKANQIAVYDASAWVYYTPREGVICFVEGEGKLCVYHSAAWTAGVTL